MLIEGIRVDGHYFEHSHHLDILLNWQYQDGPDARFFAYLGVNPPIGISVVAEQDFASIETKPSQADACMQTSPHFWGGGPSRGPATQSAFCAERNSRCGCPCSLHCLLQNGLKFGFRAYRLFALRGCDWAEWGCAVLNLSARLIGRAAKT